MIRINNVKKIEPKTTDINLAELIKISALSIRFRLRTEVDSDPE